MFKTTVSSQILFSLWLLSPLSSLPQYLGLGGTLYLFTKTGFGLDFGAGLAYKLLPLVVQGGGLIWWWKFRYSVVISIVN